MTPLEPLHQCPPIPEMVENMVSSIQIDYTNIEHKEEAQKLRYFIGRYFWELLTTDTFINYKFTKVGEFNLCQNRFSRQVPVTFAPILSRFCGLKISVYHDFNHFLNSDLEIVDYPEKGGFASVSYSVYVSTKNSDFTKKGISFC
jgi:hypothetical protein